MDDEIAELMSLQAEVISRRQLLAAGAAPHDLKRWVRQRRLVRLFPGVYVGHTGHPTWLQRAWAGTLACKPAALYGDSAIRAVVGPGWRGYDDRAPIHLAVARGRTIAEPPGCRLHRLSDLEGRVLWQAGPPRQRLEDAVLHVAAARRSDWDAFGVLAEACGSRRTTAARLLAAVDRLPRLPRRRFLQEALADVAAGSCSVLEQGYLSRVERAHGIPTAERQVTVRNDRGREYRDVEYRRYKLVLELDGRIHHDNPRQRDLDLDRDLDVAAAGGQAVRLGWGQVFGRPCRSATRVADLLQARGWAGTLSRCGPNCTILPRSGARLRGDRTV